MDTKDAEQLMLPFFPHDPYLAVQSLSKAMFDYAGVLLPNWIWETIVQQYFTFLHLQVLHMKQEHLREQIISEDPFHMNTIPYLIPDHPLSN